MFERFTAGARAAVVAAQEEARAFGHPYIGTEHTLIALLAEDDGRLAAVFEGTGVTADFVRDEVRRRISTPFEPDLSFTEADAEDAAALKAIGIDLGAVRAAIEANFGTGALHLPRPAAKKKRGLFALFSAGDDSPRHVPFTRRNKKVLELSLREAIRLRQNFIAPEHILLGLLREGEGLAALILADKGVDFDKLTEDLTTSLKGRAA
jgi:ATP-dependent Clp protease ATP-binding subunit ClpA